MVESGEGAWSSEGGEKREQVSLGYLIRLQEGVCFVCVYVILVAHLHLLSLFQWELRLAGEVHE